MMKTKLSELIRKYREHPNRWSEKIKFTKYDALTEAVQQATKKTEDLHELFEKERNGTD